MGEFGGIEGIFCGHSHAGDRTRSDFTPDEAVCDFHKHGIEGSRTAVSSFFKRHNISFEKKPARRGAKLPGRGSGSRCWKRRQVCLILIPPDWCSSTRPRPIRKWPG